MAMNASGPVASPDMSDLGRVPPYRSIEALLSESSSCVYADGYDDRSTPRVDHAPKRTNAPSTSVTGEALPGAAAKLLNALSEASPDRTISLPPLPPTTARVRHASAASVNRAIDKRATTEVRQVERDRARITSKILELQYEWDVDRVVEAQASLILFALALLALFSGASRWLYLALLVSAMLLMHALHGWSPALDLLRLLGVRTAAEIHEEVVALKAMRGDFSNVQSLPTLHVMRHSRLVPTVCDKLGEPNGAIDAQGRYASLVGSTFRSSDKNI